MSMDAAKFTPEPDLHPLYPEPQCVQQLLMDPGLSPQQKPTLVEHSLLRACTFAELPLFTFLLSDPRPRPYIDLDLRDEGGLSLVSITIGGFGTGVLIHRRQNNVEGLYRLSASQDDHLRPRERLREIRVSESK